MLLKLFDLCEAVLPGGWNSFSFNQFLITEETETQQRRKREAGGLIIVQESC